MSLIKRDKTTPIKAKRTKKKGQEELLEELTSEEVSQRRSASKALAVFPDAALPIVEALALEGSPTVREAMLTTLIQIGDEVSVKELTSYLRSEDVGLRNEVFEVLKAKVDLCMPILDNLLVDPDSDIRIYAVNLLEAMRDPEVENKIIMVLEEETHVNVCATALNLLGEIGTEASLPILDSVKTRFADEPYICFTADLTIGRIHGNR